MFFQRLASKTDLVNTVVAQTHGLPDSLNGSVSDMLVGVCEVRHFLASLYGVAPGTKSCYQMRGRLSSLSTLCKRFASILRRCDVDSFLNVGRLYQEIAPMEKRIDMHIDLLRREEFREMECVSDIVKCALLFIPVEITTDPPPQGSTPSLTISVRLTLPDSTSIWERGNWGTRCRSITTSICSLLRLG